MTLIKSISGIRGTIGGKPGDNLTPLDAVKFASAYGSWLRQSTSSKELTVVIGRDARPSGEMIQSLVQNTLTGMGINVIDLGLSTTPTVEMAVVFKQAHGGIILTASHNPVQWNALKLLNEKGEFLSSRDGKKILELAEKEDFEFAEVESLGKVYLDTGMLDKHIEAIINLPYIDVEAIQKSDLKVAVDAVNSSGGIAIPALLKRLGVQEIVEIYCEPNGQFPHNPEPLEQHLGDIMKTVAEENCDLGIVVDPDVDRLALIMDNGQMFGEEYTLVAVADYYLDQQPGPVVSNLSSSRALRDLANQKGQSYFASAVGEVNVVEMMKAQKAVLGGEGNGGVIVPDLHYGRDALVGVALILSHLARSGKRLSELRAGYSAYFMAKNKIQLEAGMDVDALLEEVHRDHKDEEVSTVDGVKIDFAEEWVHLRKSNTEPIIRIYTEAKSKERAEQLGQEFIEKLNELAN